MLFILDFLHTIGLAAGQQVQSNGKVTKFILNAPKINSLK
jgi:hypothetical protein